MRQRLANISVFSGFIIVQRRPLRGQPGLSVCCLTTTGVAGVWKPWDWAAGVLIATEAGAAISAGDGGDFRLMGDTMLGAATAELASSLREVLKDI